MHISDSTIDIKQHANQRKKILIFFKLLFMIYREILWHFNNFPYLRPRVFSDFNFLFIEKKLQTKKFFDRYRYEKLILQFQLQKY